MNADTAPLLQLRLKMSTHPLTPTRSSPSASPPPSFLIPTIPYDTAFEDSLMRTILTPPAGDSDGVTILDSDSAAAAPGYSVIASDVDPSDFPHVAQDELPLPLNDARRVYRSSIPGVRLTHPGGLFEGGPGPASSASHAEVDTYAQDFIDTHDIRTPEQLRKRVEEEKAVWLREARARMRAREEAIEKNEKVEREIKQLLAQREMEIRIMKKLREQAGKKSG